jgi:hypothetical protein
MPSRCPYQLFLHDGERLRNFACERVRDRFGKRDTLASSVSDFMMTLDHVDGRLLDRLNVR